MELDMERPIKTDHELTTSHWTKEVLADSSGKCVRIGYTVNGWRTSGGPVVRVLVIKGKVVLDLAILFRNQSEEPNDVEAATSLADALACAAADARRLERKMGGTVGAVGAGRESKAGIPSIVERLSEGTR